MYWPTTRARMSVVPPAEKGTMIVIGLAGKPAWALAARGASDRTAAAAAARVKVRRFGAVSKESRDMGNLSRR